MGKYSITMNGEAFTFSAHTMEGLKEMLSFLGVEIPTKNNVVHLEVVKSSQSTETI